MGADRHRHRLPHLQGVKKLNLTGSLLASIYFGKITKWNDPKIKKINPGVKLPGLTITPVFRSDGSGDTYAFTSYLSKVSPAWKKEVGSATSVQFPKRRRRQRQLRRHLDRHLDQRFDRLHLGLLPDRRRPRRGRASEQGRQVRAAEPEEHRIGGVLRDAPARNANTVNITNPPAKASIAYPLSTFTYAIVPHNAPQKGFLQQFLNYAVTHGPEIRSGARLRAAAESRLHGSQKSDRLPLGARPDAAPVRQTPGWRGGAGRR